jgi:DNA-binding MarR family transcriptional regulator
MFASDHTTPSEARPAPPRAAAPRIVARPVQPPLQPEHPPTSPPDGSSGSDAAAPVSAPAGGGRASAAPLDVRAPAHLRTLPSWLLSQASAAGAQLVDGALSADGVRRQDYRVLVALDEFGAASQADLGRAVWLDRSDLHGVVTQLERRGLLERERDPADRRRNVVQLTTEGRATLERLNGRVDEAQARLLAELPAADRATLVRLLQTLVHTRPLEPS